jgi:hypothetical protein
MGPQIILAMNTTALLCSHQPNRRYIVVAFPALALCDATYRRRQRSRSSGVFAPPERSASVLFAPPQQQLPRNSCHATIALALQQRSFSFCTRPHFQWIQTHTHTVFLLSFRNNDRKRRSAVFCSDATTIITIECHAAQQRNNQQSLSQRQPSQRR